jgi:hypothetical protein
MSEFGRDGNQQELVGHHPSLGMPTLRQIRTQDGIARGHDAVTRMNGARTVMPDKCLSK